MRPDVVTFWHGPLDALRLTCLRSQVAAGHKVTVYSFDPLAGLPDGVGNAEAEAILPHSFSERLRPPQPDGSWRDWTILQFSDFFRMRLMAAKRRPVARCRRAAAEAGRDRSGKTLFRLGAAAPARQFGVVSAAGRSDRDGVRKSDEAGRTDAGLAGAAPSPDLHAAATCAADRTASPISALRSSVRPRSPRWRAAETNCSTRCRSNHSMRCMPSRNCFSSQRIFQRCSPIPRSSGCTFRQKAAAAQKPIPGSLYAWAAEKFGA